MSQALQEGAVFAGRYRVVRCMAYGGMGAVYEVVHLETDRRRALKVMHPHTLQNDEMRERFKREARVAAHVESDFIVDVFDAGVDEPTGMPFLVMELLRGEELGKRLKRLGRFSPEEVVAYLHQTALALDKTHRASIIHRDLKPENLFLTERDDGPSRVKVLDFGIAKLMAEGASAGATTQSIGTPLYMSPEQFNPAIKLSGASDIYSLGMVAYSLLVGAAYWEEEGRGGNIFAIAAAAIYGPKEPASARAARRGVTLSPAFDAWFARVAAADPAQRFSPATAAVRELAQVFELPASAWHLFAATGTGLEAPRFPSTESSPRLPLPSGALTPGTLFTGGSPAPIPGLPATPGTTASNASVTAPVSQAKGNRALIVGLVFGLSCLLFAGTVLFASRSSGIPAVAGGGDATAPLAAISPTEAPAAPPPASASAAAVPSLSASAPLPSAAPAAAPSSVAAAPPPRKDKPAAAVKPPAGAGTAPPRSKYTQD